MQPKNPTTNTPQGPFKYCTNSTPLPPPPTSAPLAPYILRAETSTFGRQISRPSIFPSPSHTPHLARGRTNRILVFSGCFNPPHYSHLELLAHVFLRSDSSTVAAVIYPGSIGDTSKENALVKGRVWAMGKEERREMWHGEVLSRMGWVYMGRGDKMYGFQREVVRLAGENGFRVEFVGLVGSDHVRLDGRIGRAWGGGDVVSSDVTRGSELLGDGAERPREVEGCGEWREIMTRGEDGCWACRKFRAMCPEFVGEEVTEGTPVLSNATFHILRRCHDDGARMWWCYNGSDMMWFFQSGRKYPTDESRPTISSTIIRKLLDECERDEIVGAVKDMVLSAEKLVDMIDHDDGKDEEQDG